MLIIVYIGVIHVINQCFNKILIKNPTPDPPQLNPQHKNSREVGVSIPIDGQDCFQTNTIGTTQRPKRFESYLVPGTQHLFFQFLRVWGPAIIAVTNESNHPAPDTTSMRLRSGLFGVQAGNRSRSFVCFVIWAHLSCSRRYPTTCSRIRLRMSSFSTAVASYPTIWMLCAVWLSRMRWLLWGEALASTNAETCHGGIKRFFINFESLFSVLHRGRWLQVWSLQQDGAGRGVSFADLTVTRDKPLILRRRCVWVAEVRYVADVPVVCLSPRLHNSVHTWVSVFVLVLKNCADT